MDNRWYCYITIFSLTFQGEEKMKLPNGYGNVSKLSGSRRKPWRARKTVKIEVSGGKLKQCFETIGYFPTKADALQALADFNSDPYDLIAAKKTFGDIYKMWADKHFEELADESQRNYRNFVKYCEPVFDIQISKIKTAAMQKTLDGLSRPSAQRVRIIYNQVFKFAMQKEWVSKDYSEALSLPETAKKESKPKTPFSIEEIKTLWAHKEAYENQIALILIYSGVRISELLNLLTEDVHLDQQYFEIRKSKTDSGVRIVPIADIVLPLWENIVTGNNKYAFPAARGEHIEYSNFAHNYWPLVNKCVGSTHTIHETRHTCTSLLTMANVNHTIIKKIVGHKSSMDLTERTYTHIYVKNLLDAINKIEI